MERIGYTIFYSHNINLFIHVKKKKRENNIYLRHKTDKSTHTMPSHSHQDA